MSILTYLALCHLWVVSVFRWCVDFLHTQRTQLPALISTDPGCSKLRALGSHGMLIYYYFYYYFHLLFIYLLNLFELA